MEPIIKRHSVSVTISTLASLLAVSGALWLFAKPFIAKAVAEELTTQVTQIVDNKVSPLSAGLQILIQGNISRLQDRITEKEFQKEEANRTSGDNLIWTLNDEKDLRELYKELDLQESALEKMAMASQGEDYETE